jgi:hypothetical protein
MDAEHDTEEPLARYEITESSVPPEKWALLLDANRLRLESTDGVSHEIAWAERHERVQLHDRVMLRRVMVAKPRKKFGAIGLDRREPFTSTHPLGLPPRDSG